MKVILRTAVKNLGKAGDIKEVKKGYGFNYLLPEGLADLATPGVVKSVQKAIASERQDKDAEVAEVAAVLKALNGKKFTLSAKAEGDKLFGSVTSADIVRIVSEAGSEITPEMVVLEHPIKTVGEHKVALQAGQSKASITVTVSGE